MSFQQGYQSCWFCALPHTIIFYTLLYLCLVPQLFLIYFLIKYFVIKYIYFLVCCIYLLNNSILFRRGWSRKIKRKWRREWARKGAKHSASSFSCESGVFQRITFRNPTYRLTESPTPLLSMPSPPLICFPASKEPPPAHSSLTQESEVLRRGQMKPHQLGHYFSWNWAKSKSLSNG